MDFSKLFLHVLPRIAEWLILQCLPSKLLQILESLAARFNKSTEPEINDTKTPEASVEIQCREFLSDPHRLRDMGG